MIRIILVFGALAGAVVLLTLGIGIAVHLCRLQLPEWAGYLFMLAALSLIFAGVKRYRDRERGGVITLWQGLGVGLGIAGIASVVYVLGWEAYLWATHYSFFPIYEQSALAAKKAAGASATELARFKTQLDAMALAYSHPLSRMAITLSEIAPLAIVVAMLSALALRFRKLWPTRSK